MEGQGTLVQREVLEPMRVLALLGQTSSLSCERLYAKAQPSVFCLLNCHQHSILSSGLSYLNIVLFAGEKPHQCQVCGKTFSQSGSRNVHMRKHHLQLGTTGSQEQEQTGEEKGLLENCSAARPLASLANWKSS